MNFKISPVEQTKPDLQHEPNNNEYTEIPQNLYEKTTTFYKVIRPRDALTLKEEKAGGGSRGTKKNRRSNFFCPN